MLLIKQFKHAENIYDRHIYAKLSSLYSSLSFKQNIYQTKHLSLKAAAKFIKFFFWLLL
jgi:hypothetical protein